jgi:hypothetical protein
MKTNYQHQALAAGGWSKLSLVEQLANVGSEIFRAMAWRKKRDLSYSNKAMERGLELLSLTIGDRKNIGRLKELTRLKEALIDYFMFDNVYGSSDEKWERYFYAFSFAARNPFYRNKR